MGEWLFQPEAHLRVFQTQIVVVGVGSVRQAHGKRQVTSTREETNKNDYSNRS